MSVRRAGARTLDSRRSDNYTPEQVKATLEALGVEIAGQTYTDFICYCPFHGNTASPAFTVGVENGLYLCHNPSCDGNKGGNLRGLVLRLSDRTDMEALRFIDKKGSEVQKPLDVHISAMQAEERWPILPQMKIDELVNNFWKTQKALDYMRNEREFDDQTLREFEVGYDSKKDMVVVPIHDKDGNPVGVNGRSVNTKRFKLSKRVPRNKILFNMHRAKRAGGTAIFCESQFDTMRIYQAGFPNAVSPLGSHISKEQAALLQRYFERIIIMTDADKPGRAAGHTLASMVRGMRVEWAIWDWGIIYPHKAKDAGDMTEDEIAKCINNAVPHVAYESYKTLA